VVEGGRGLGVLLEGIVALCAGYQSDGSLYLRVMDRGPRLYLHDYMFKEGVA